MAEAKIRAGFLYDWALKAQPDATAVVFKDRTISFRELHDAANRISNGLLALGLNRQDRVAVLMSNSIEALIVIQAIELAGLVFVRLNPLESNDERRYILDDSGAALIVLDRGFADEWLAYEQTIDASWVKLCVPAFEGEACHSFDELLASFPPVRPEILVGRDDMINIAYTSGTTGRPKGVVNTHGTTLNRVRNDFLNLDLPLGPDDVLLTVAPLTHAAGLIAQQYSIRGARNVVHDRFDVEEVLTAIETHRVTGMLAVPTMIVRLLQHPRIDEFDLASLRRIYYGTAPMPVEHLKRAIEVFGNIFRQQYGLTEHGQPVLYLYPEDHVVADDDRGRRRLASMGRRVIGVEVKIADDEGAAKPTGEPGEIWVRSDAGMAGYWKNPQATAETVTGDGWLKTGDIGVEDSDGYITMVDRKKEMIISGGFNVYPREVEAALEQHPAILECAVFGVPHYEWGEAVTAAVVPAPGAELADREVIDFCRGRVARYKVPKFVEFHDELPRNTAGKLLRRVLREPHWKNRSRSI
jgi:acyl-CoA synthetase (AMP-forming)/AMP-acid ligase II